MKKRSFIVFCILILSLSTNLFAQKKSENLTDEEADVAQIISTVRSVRAPFIKNDYVVFTQEARNYRYVAIAFDFEDFTKIHKFQKKTVYGDDDEVVSTFYFYVHKLPKSVQNIYYRIIVDGLWTTDPQNPNFEYNEASRVSLSVLNVSRTIPLVTEKKDDGFVHFVYLGKSGQKIRLGGNFTGWDSWIYEMKETSVGIYECSLPLPPGTYQYSYYTGIKSFPDVTNPNRCYTSDGKEASLIVVE